MTGKELDRLLERSVAQALGVEMPQRPRRPRKARQPALILPRRLVAHEAVASHA